MSTLHPNDETIRVLFIENDAAVAEMYKLKLELDGYQVAVIANGDHVLDEVTSRRPDMIFLDLRPGEDQGVATWRQLRASACTRAVPVIILSRQGPKEMAGRGFKADLLDYVVRAEPVPDGLPWSLRDTAQVASG